MQGPDDDDAEGRTGRDRVRRDGRRRPQAAEDRPRPQSSGTDGDDDGSPRPSGPQDGRRQAALVISGQGSPQDGRGQGSPQDGCGQGSPQDGRDQGSPQDGRGQGSPAASAEEAAIVAQEEQGSLVPGPSGDAATAVSRILEFSVRVPFSSAVEADMARRSLVANAQRQLLMVPQEFTVNDAILAVRWTTEDPLLFRISINNFLDQLSLVMRNIQHLQFVAFKRRRERSRHH